MRDEAARGGAGERSAPPPSRRVARPLSGFAASPILRIASLGGRLVGRTSGFGPGNGGSSPSPPASAGYGAHAASGSSYSHSQTGSTNSTSEIAISWSVQPQ